MGNGHRKLDLAKVTSFLSLLISLAALALAGWVFVRADALADEALQRRERRMVERLKPHVLPIYADFDARVPPSIRDSQTLEELFTPMIDLVQALAGDG